MCSLLPDQIQLEIRPSNIPGAGLGVFLSPSFPLTIPAGCPVTSYGGKLMAHQDVKDFVYALRVGNEVGSITHFGFDLDFVYVIWRPSPSGNGMSDNDV
jgi:hypothetical protein